MKRWYVYLVRCKDGTLYAGITTDVARRLREHNTSPKSARYTRARRPVRLLRTETFSSRSEASKREYVIKQFTRSEKLNLVKKNRKKPAA